MRATPGELRGLFAARRPGAPPSLSGGGGEQHLWQAGVPAAQHVLHERGAEARLAGEDQAEMRLDLQGRGGEGLSPLWFWFWRGR